MKYLVYAFLLLAGCGWLPTAPTQPELVLMAPQTGPAPTLLKQVVTLTKDGEKQQFLSLVRLSPQTVKLVALLPNGQKIMTVEYDGKHFYQQSGISDTLPGRKILALVQLALWPETAISDQYPDPWSFSQRGDTRKLRFRDTPWVLVVDDADSRTITHHLDGYTINVLTLSEEGL